MATLIQDAILCGTEKPASLQRVIRRKQRKQKVKFRLVSYLRPSGVDAARHAWGILALLVKALRARWPRVKIVFRGDSGFCRWRMLRWCEAHGVGYIVGIARNPRLQRQAEALLECAKRDYQATGRKQRRFGSVWVCGAHLGTGRGG